MKRMQHGRRGPAGPSERARGGLIRRAGRAVSKFATIAVLSAGLALAGPSITTGPEGPKITFGVKEAKAITPIKIKGMTVYRFKLSDTITNLDRKSKKFRKGGAVLKVPASGLTTTVGLNRPGSGRNNITLSFPKSATDKTIVDTGYKLDDFVKLVRKVTGKTPTKVKLIVEFTKDGNQRVINVFAIPLDSKGNVLGKLPKGQLAMGVSYYPNKVVVKPAEKVAGAHVLLREPTKRLNGAVATAED